MSSSKVRSLVGCFAVSLVMLLPLQACHFWTATDSPLQDVPPIEGAGPWTLAFRHLEAWKALNDRIAPDGSIVVGDSSAGVSLSTELNGHRIEQLMQALLGFEEGRRVLAWSGLHLVGAAYISDEVWPRFQDLVEARGLPRPPNLEPSYDIRLDDGTMVIMIREGWEDDAVTLLREAEYTTSIRLFYDEDITVSPTVDRQFRRFLDTQHVSRTPGERDLMRDVFVRLYGNLRSRRTLRLARDQGQRIDSYYRGHGILASREEFDLDLRESLVALFRNDWRDIFYYGTTLFGVQVPEGLTLGDDSTTALEAWIRSNVDLDALELQVRSSVSDEINEALAPLLQPKNPAYYRHLSHYRRMTE